MATQPGPSKMHPDDPGFEEWCLNILENGNDSDEDPDYVIESDHDTDSEISGDEENRTIIYANKTF